MPTPTLAAKATLDTAQFEASMRGIAKAAAAAAANIGNNFKGIGTSLTTPFAALAPAIAAAFSTRAIAGGIKDVFEMGRSLQVLSRQSGVGVRNLFLLQSQFKAAGVEAGQLGPALFRVSRLFGGIDDEGGKGVERLKELGLNMAELRRGGPAAELIAVGRALAAIPDPGRRAAVTMDILGRQGKDLQAVFSADFGKVPEGLFKRATEMAANSATFEESSIKLAKAGNVFKSFYSGAAAGLGGELNPLLDKIISINLADAGREFGKGLGEGAKAMNEALSGFKAADIATIAKDFAQGLTGAFKDALGFAKDLKALVPVGEKLLSMPGPLGDKAYNFLTEKGLTPWGDGTLRGRSGPLTDREGKTHGQGIDPAMRAGIQDWLTKRNFASIGASGSLGAMLGVGGKSFGERPLSTPGAGRPETRAGVDMPGIAYGIAEGFTKRLATLNPQSVFGSLGARLGQAITGGGGGSSLIDLLPQVSSAIRAKEAGTSEGDAGRSTQPRTTSTIGGDNSGFALRGHFGGIIGGDNTNFGLLGRSGLIGQGALSGGATPVGGGAGGALDMDGGRSGLTTGGLRTGGLGGGAYGRTNGSIWTQLSGHAKKPETKDEKMLEHLYYIRKSNDDMLKAWTSGGGGGGGGGATVAK